MPRAHLFGSGPLLREALRAQEILRDKFDVAADVWSVTSYNELYREGMSCGRWNRLHPDKSRCVPYVRKVLEGEPWPIVAVSDFVKQIPLRIDHWTPKAFTRSVPTAFGRSDSREDLRRFFEINAEHIAYATLWELSQHGQYDEKKLPKALKTLEIDPVTPDPAKA